MTRVHAARRRADRRICARAPAVPADPGGARARHRGVPVGRGQELLQACRHRPEGIVRAVVVNVRTAAPASARRAPRRSPSRSPRTSCSSNEQTYERKIQEALLALRIEPTYLEGQDPRALSERDLSRRSAHYGVAAAALELFRQVGARADPRRGRLSRGAAQGAENYHPFRNPERAIERRNWVIDRMVENGYITREEGEAAKAEPLGVNPRTVVAEQYRRRIFRRGSAPRAQRPYGEKKLYEGGLSVRTTLDPKLQADGAQGAASTAWSRSTRRAAGAARSQKLDIAGRTGAWRSARCRRSDDVPAGGSRSCSKSPATGRDRPAAEARDVRGSCDRTATRQEP